MEKYTVDIDKVLDDFEETEALKIDDSHKNTHTSMVQPSMFINYNEQTQSDTNDVGCIYENASQFNENDADSNEKNITSDKDTQSQSLNKGACPKHLDLPDECTPKDSNFKENGVEVSEIKNTPEQICVSSKSSYSAVLIPNGIKIFHNSCYSSNVTSNENNEKCNLINEFDSVNAIKTALTTVSESHSVKEGTVLLPINSTCDKNECFQNFHLSCFDIAEQIKSRTGNFQELEGIKWDFDEPEITEETVTKFSNNVVSLTVSDDSEQNCDANTETAEPPSFIEKNLAISKIEAAASEADEPSSQNDSLKSASNSAAQDNKELQIVEQRVLPHPEYECISEDDDSGVSSEEGNNSPLFFFNNQMLNGDDGAHAVANQETGLSENLDKLCNNQEDLENRTSCISNESIKLNKEVTKNNENISEFQPIDEVLLSESTVNSLSSNKFTGARPKLDGQISQNPVPDASNDEIEIQSDNKIVKDDCGNSSEIDIQQNKTETVSEISEAVHCDISDPPDVVPAYSSYNPESEFNDDKSREAELDNEVSVNEKSVSTDTNKECPHPSDLKTDNFQQRLSRPTTLDLPSRHLAVSQSIGESNVSVTGTNNTQTAPATDFLSSENLGDDSASEPFPRQQPKIGLVKPFWIPDAEAPNCMHCGVKFTVIKRRHHCRACGKVLCSRCCNLKAKLAYLNKEDRICHPCFEILSSTSQNEDLTSTAADSQSSSSCGSSPNFSPSPQLPSSNFDDKNSWRPHPNNPDDYCSTIPPLQQIQLSGARPPPTVMVPIGVLKRGNKPRREPKQVIFSDGIRPGGDLTDLTEPADVIPAYRRIGRKRVEKPLSGEPCNAGGSSPSLTPQRSKQKRILVSDDEGPLPPVILHYDNGQAKEEKLDWTQLIERMQDDDQKPVNFALMKNMHLFVKLTKLDCCFGKECWCFTSHGLCAVAQDEIMVLLERLPGENILPRGIIKLFTHIYDSASKGSTFDDLSHVIFPEQILGSSDHRGFLFVRPTFQCLSKLIVPNTPFLVAILIHKWEVPWAKVFPLRLMLRLGAECRYYPCALVSVRHRKPVFFEIGQTIMSVLADLRNYQFTIPVIPGLVVHMEEKKTCVNIPRNRYEKVMKVLNSNNVEHVLALGSNFSSEADSHLVCMQKEEGDYQTQAINIENTTRRVTGASFIVFSGALKSSSGLSAKFSIVEDGLLVQIPQETMVALHMALRDMKDLTIECGQINAAEPEEVVIIQWTRDDKKFNLGVRSPIDYRTLEGIPSLRIHTSTDYAGDSYLIRWTEVFFLEVDENSSNSCTIQHELVDPCRLAETVAQSCCMALAPYLDQLAESELTKIGLRVTLDSERDRVEYDIGARGKPLPAIYMNALDCGLIPVILRLSSSAQSEPVSFELIFYILIK